MKRYIMTGLIMLLPLALTLWILGTVVDWLTGPFTGITANIIDSFGMHKSSFLFLTPEQTFLVVEKILILIFLFFFVLTIGAIGKQYAIAYLLRLGDNLLHRIPVISSVYKTSQELITTIFTTQNKAFKQVVFVPFPEKGSLVIGLVTREEAVDPSLVPVFVPTTPNPTSGYLIMYDRKSVIPINMTVEEAFRYIISCGTLVNKEAIVQTHDHYEPEKVEK